MPAGIKLATSVGIPIPRFTYIPSLNSCAMRLAIPYLSKGILFTIYMLWLLSYKPVIIAEFLLFFFLCAFHNWFPGKFGVHIHLPHEPGQGLIRRAALIPQLLQL